MGSATEERARASAGSPLKTRHDAFVHPLQDLGMPAAPAPSVGNAYHPAATSNGPNSTATATLAVPSSSAAATTSTTWSSLSSNFASFASRAAASVQSAVENAEAAVLHGGAVSGPAPPTAASASHGQHAGGPGHVPRQPPVVSYQERQKMLHRKYHHHGASSLGGGAPTPSPPVDSSATNSNIHPSAPSSSSSVSPPSTATPPTPSSSTTPPTFLEKLTTALDAATKTKLVSSALGPLLPGERVIMFLNSLNDVKDSRFPHLMVGSDDVLGGNLRRCLSFGSGRTEEGDGDAAVTVWCCVMTFYRVAVMSYRCSLEGQVLFDDDDDDGGYLDDSTPTASRNAMGRTTHEDDYDSDEVEDAISASGDALSMPVGTFSTKKRASRDMNDDDGNDGIDDDDDAAAAVKSLTEIEQAKRLRGKARRREIGITDEGKDYFDDNDDDDDHECGVGAPTGALGQRRRCPRHGQCDRGTGPCLGGESFEDATRRVRPSVARSGHARGPGSVGWQCLPSRRDVQRSQLDCDCDFGSTLFLGSGDDVDDVVELIFQLRILRLSRRGVRPERRGERRGRGAPRRGRLGARASDCRFRESRSACRRAGPRATATTRRFLSGEAKDAASEISSSRGVVPRRGCPDAIAACRLVGDQLQHPSVGSVLVLVGLSPVHRHPSHSLLLDDAPHISRKTHHRARRGHQNQTRVLGAGAAPAG
mmetsp:Transcript_2352/g.5492  ORF Transcript_2352/g.5492 Transcript_2352/m.5492 type:complete len:705 (+) Transcript_2352:451-2565(+)